MAKLRVLTIIGTRPEAIKMAPVVKELASRRDEVDSFVVATAQHREMLDQVLDLFHITPQRDLDVMLENQDLFQLTREIVEKMEPVYREFSPQLALVQGDTTTTFIGSLLSYYWGSLVGHVEAGLRSGDKQNPYPEEINRRLTSVLADYHFAPTARARENLLREGVPEARIAITGNPVIDALLLIAREPFDLSASGPLQGLPLEGRRLVLVTAHRRENFGKPLRNICRALIELAQRFKELAIIYPVHPNPNVRRTVEAVLSGRERIHLTEPIDYRTCVHLMKRSYIILTDSGGIQEEAPTFGTPVLVLRRVTERPEAVEAGAAQVVGTDPGHILSAATSLLTDETRHQAMSRAINPFGDGRAAGRIVTVRLERRSEIIAAARRPAAYVSV
ncbi:MAG: non-hydrolyzing UDP-N-acetylglucosamine 2-epimerase [Nitrospinota bacterium]